MSWNASTVVTMCCLATGSVAPCQAEIFDSNPVVVIRVENPTGLEVPDLARAQQLASEIYMRAGISLR